MSAPALATGQVYRVAYRTEAGRIGGVLLIAGSPDEAVAKLRARDSIMAGAPRMVATATADMCDLCRRSGWHSPCTCAGPR